MRIRKRKVPFPLSSLSPVPLSDPPFADPLQLQSNPHRNFSPGEDKPSDQPNNYIGDGASRQNSSDYTSKQAENKFLRNEGRDQDGDQNGGEEREKISNDSRKETIPGAKTPITSLHQGEKVFPLKKRRGSLDRRKSNGETISEKDKKMKTNEIKSGVKKRVRGGALMEGSRCSRVNGRGWRCCQPTLVGYSLCEHHLGKGRLRSMTSVRSRSSPNKVESRPSLIGPIEGEDIKLISSNEDEKQQHQLPLLMSKRKNKLGMVKARSISSLLGQANNATFSIAENEE